MTNLTNLTYGELQAIAKGFGVPANLKREVLEQILSAMMFQAQAQAQEEATPVQNQAPQTQVAPQESAMANVFDLPVQEAPKNAMPRTNGYVSPALMKFCLDLYERFGLDKSELEGKDYRFVQNKVNELQNRPSPKQMDIINQTLAELADLGCPLEVDQEVLDGLTGGREGTASQLIELLFEKRREAELTGKPNEKQLNTLVKWFFCPDIPWENFNIALKVGVNVEGIENAWRHMTPEEFMEEVASKMTMAEAGQFIAENQVSYYEWEKTRIKSWQVDRIRGLEERMANLYMPAIMKTVIVDGKITQVAEKVQRQYNPQAYTPMSEQELKQLSSEDADKLIIQMQSELRNPVRGSLNNSNAQDQFEMKVHGDPREARGGSAELRAVNREHQAVTDFIFGLEAVVGQENEELHESVTELMIQKVGDSLEVANKLREFIEFALDMKAITMQGLVSMGSKSQTISRLLQIINPEQYDSAVNGKRDENAPKIAVQQSQSKAQAFINSLK